MRNIAVKLHCITVTLNARVEVVEICSVSAPINMMPLKLIIIIFVINWHINYSYTLYRYFSLFCGQLGKLKKLSVQKYIYRDFMRIQSLSALWTSLKVVEHFIFVCLHFPPHA